MLKRVSDNSTSTQEKEIATLKAKVATLETKVALFETRLAILEHAPQSSIADEKPLKGYELEIGGHYSTRNMFGMDIEQEIVRTGYQEISRMGGCRLFYSKTQHDLLYAAYIVSELDDNRRYLFFHTKQQFRWFLETSYVMASAGLLHELLPN